ncbi:EamA family transporter [Erwinia tracheiphila]|uniref:Probable 4-amino-4-deoxy-L-arabinose-phosphoundecaprenol flippase subunit ArnF n=1 Tax=Erwinia tracheiphila TaxID=65700 RepID=A0A345CP37_9GAMM|nr:4-amino-4-deoxy-L-arabinose-phosphoundecaprenol flippase subunit ArnF [Erwinia tracheiphila]AXF75204.1 4-amino-4-deoxy-L-arabinose-phospho-UDP flippase [Erwinia tracheiphila]UIA82249.1 EamA family transporter [Erwinia tracheiphila]UIA90846.1 EamA family transporter [Erwinia tracheiphila]
MGVLLALCSVLLVSGAQLLMRWSMMRLPSVSDISLFVNDLLQCSPATLGLACGILAYVLSMFCWFLALQRMALSKAYPLLSLSYVMVWAMAMLLPELNEVFQWARLVGVLMIFCGLLLVCWPAPTKSEQ